MRSLYSRFQYGFDDKSIILVILLLIFPTEIREEFIYEPNSRFHSIMRILMKRIWTLMITMTKAK